LTRSRRLTVSLAPGQTRFSWRLERLAARPYPAGTGIGSPEPYQSNEPDLFASRIQGFHGARPASQHQGARRGKGEVRPDPSPRPALVAIMHRSGGLAADVARRGCGANERKNSGAVAHDWAGSGFGRKEPVHEERRSKAQWQGCDRSGNLVLAERTHHRRKAEIRRLLTAMIQLDGKLSVTASERQEYRCA
jgi:hypothetical protein